MAFTEARSRANKKWDKENLDRIQLIVRAGEKDQIKEAAKAAGESLNHYIVWATKLRMRSEGFNIGSSPINENNWLLRLSEMTDEEISAMLDKTEGKALMDEMRTSDPKHSDRSYAEWLRDT